jgi:hypothetical protein
MKAKLKSNIVVEELGKETKLNRLHAASSLRYTPSASQFKVISTGNFLKRFLGNTKTFDPFAFSMTKEAKSAEEAREKTLCVDFVIAHSPPRQPNEDPILPNASEMLAKCYNRFLIIARAMEVGDERAVWMAIKDGVFSTAHNLTRIHDARMTLSTGSKSFTNKASSDDGMIRKKTQKRLSREAAKKGGFFPAGGGQADPPVQPYYNAITDAASYDIFSPYYDQEDLLAGSVLASTAGWQDAARGRGAGGGGARGNAERFRGRPPPRGGGFARGQNQQPPALARGQAQGRRFNRRGNGQGRGGGNLAPPAWGDGVDAHNQAGAWGNA